MDPLTLSQLIAHATTQVQNAAAAAGEHGHIDPLHSLRAQTRGQAWSTVARSAASASSSEKGREGLIRAMQAEHEKQTQKHRHNAETHAYHSAAITFENANVLGEALTLLGVATTPIAALDGGDSLEYE